MTEPDLDADPDAARAAGEAAGGAKAATGSTHHSVAKTMIGGTAAAAAQPLATGRQLGPYQLLEKLGEGGMGTVYKARHLKLGKIMAVKLLPPQALQNKEIVSRFEREMLAVGQVQHPNIVQAHDAGEVNGVHYLAMEYVEGQDLQKLLDSKTRLSVQNACKIIRQASLGLAAAHQIGLVHRDLKPANLFITKGGQIKVLDLGLARLGQEAAGLTSTGECFGTPDYMAPEQWEDAHICDVRTDLYALGCTLFCLLTGKPPFGNENYSSAPRKMVGHVRDAIPDLQAARPDAPAELVAIYQRLLAKNPADRPQSAQELVQLLVPFVKGTATYEATMAPAAGPRLAEEPKPPAVKPDPPRKDASKTKPAPTRQFITRLLLVAAALAGIAAIATGIIFQIETPAGTIVIEVNQPEIAGATVSVDGNQKITIKPGGNQDPIEITADAKEHTLRVVKGGFETFTLKFTVKSGKTQTIQVSLKPMEKGPLTLPIITQTEAARRLLSMGCVVTVKTGDAIRVYEGATKLPPVDAQVIAVWGANNVSLSDEDVPYLLACPQLESLESIKLKMSPAGIEKLGRAKQLTKLLLFATPLDDRRLAALASLQDLKELIVDVSLATPDGLKYLSNFINLHTLVVQGANFDDNAVSHLRLLRNLGSLILDETSVRGSGLKGLSDLKSLRFISLNWMKAGNEGLAAVSEFKQVQYIKADGAESITNEGLSHLRNMPQLRELRLCYASITNDGLKSLTSLEDLELLSLNGCKINDQGLVHLARLPRLRVLDLEHTDVGDSGLEILQKVPLTTLALFDTKITDKGLLLLKEFPRLEQLQLGKSNLTETGLAELRTISTLRRLSLHGTNYTLKTWENLGKLENLEVLILNDSNIDDAGLSKLSALKNLRQIELHRSRVTDAGLLNLKDLPRLGIVGAESADVTPAGRNALLELLPSLRGPVDRRIAEWALKLGGTIRIKQGGEEREIVKGGVLPTRDFALSFVDLSGNANVTDDNIGILRDATRLTELHLGHTQISDRGLEWIGELKQLEHLTLWHSRITGDTVSRLQPLTELRVLLLNAIPIGDKAFESIVGLKKLQSLGLQETGLTNRSVAIVAKLPELRLLGWGDFPFSASEILQIKESTRLVHLDLDGSQLSREVTLALSQLRLDHLGIENAQIQAESLEPLAANETLGSLGIQGTFKTNGAAPLARLKSLVHLYLNRSNIDDSDLAHLSNLPRLEGLALAETKISDDGLPKLENLTTLRVLDVKNTKVTAAGLQKLHLKIPQCHIEGPDGLVLKPSPR